MHKLVSTESGSGTIEAESAGLEHRPESDNPHSTGNTKRPSRGGRSVATAYERDNQILSYGWQNLSQGDIARIRRALVDEGPLERIEASLAIAACLSTGRRLSELVGLQISQIGTWRAPGDNDSDGDEPVVGLVHCASKWGWWLSAGGPRILSPGSIDALPGASRTAQNLWLPSTADVVRLAERALSRRDLRRAAKPVPLIATPTDDLRVAMKQLLREDRSVRRASATIEALERWLTNAICLSPGGDSATALVMTGRHDLRARTTSYYSSVSQATVEQSWNAAAKPLEKHVADGTIQHGSAAPNSPDEIVRAPDRQVREQAYGSQSCPADETLEALRARLVETLNAADDPAHYHLALTDYTVALLSISVALRPTKAPTLDRVAFDPETGFGVLDDKRLADGYTARLTWYPPVARTQLAIYRAHIEQLARTTLSDTTREWDITHRGKLPFFMLGVRGKLKNVGTLDVIQSLLVRHDSPMAPNFGRHFIRSKLLRRCSSETLQAFMGHWHRGTEPWGAASGLDPLLYREDLSGKLTAVLADHGWVAQGGKARATARRGVLQMSTVQ